MNRTPANAAELSSALREASSKGEKIGSINIRSLNRLLEHKSEDMTATVEAGMTLAEFQQQLGKHGQWLPLDPPNPTELTIGAMLETNASGPRRFGYGTVRDYVIGMTAALADGRLIHSGGKVVKNVAGYDLMKPFIGSHGTLGVIIEATFKVLPLPEREAFVGVKCQTREEAHDFLESISNSDLTPTVNDLHRLPADARTKLVLGFAGTDDDVEWQLSKAAALGINQPSSLDYQNEFFSKERSLRKLSVLPSKLLEFIGSLNGSFVARAGNGIIYHAETLPKNGYERPNELERRLKEQFDPQNIFPNFPE